MSYGQGDATYQAAGGEVGISDLVNHFYDIMQIDYPNILGWHSGDNVQSRDKLTRFLCGWMGGPRKYNEKYGSINIPGVHAHLAVTSVEKKQWLDCMAQALDRMDYPEALKSYLLQQLSIPAERIRQVCSSAGK